MKSNAATSLHLGDFTFRSFHALTPELVGASRAAVFAALPAAMQCQAWDRLAEETAERAAQLWTESRPA